MSHRGVHGDDQVEVEHQRRGVQEVIQPISRVKHAQLASQFGKLLLARAFLQAHQLNPRNAGQRCKALQEHRTAAIACVLGIALPGDADLEAFDATQPLSPVCNQGGVHAEVGDHCRDVRQVRAENPRQAQERCITVERGRGRTRGHQPVDAGTPRQHSQQWLLALDDQLTAELPDR